MSEMMEQKQSEDPVKSPVIQEIIMSNRIGAISMELSKRLNIDPVKALNCFTKARPALTCTTNPRDYTFMEICMWRMSLCGRWSMGCRVFGG